MWFKQVMENLGSHRVLYFQFPGLGSHEIEVWVLESYGKALYFQRIKIQRS